MKRDRVDVAVPARLHLGLLDLEGGLGRRFGSLGLTLDGPQTRLGVTRGRGLSAEGPDAERAERYLAETVRAFGLDGGFRVEIAEAIPAHNGLGSGTQLALAAGMAACRLAGREVGARALAQALGRGARSGIGIGAFEQGGVLLDGGRGDREAPPPILSRLAFPEDWRILLILDHRRDGLHGRAEIAAFEELSPFPPESAAQLCRLTLMAALPALAERDIAGFGAAVSELQRIVGDHFAPAQGGRFASPAVAELLAWLEGQGVAGVGQSSWGPTGFAFLPSEADARRLMAAAVKDCAAARDLRLEVRRGRNRGASLAVADAALVTEP